MFAIERTAVLRRNRLVADSVLVPADFDRIAGELSQTPLKARKTGLIAACRTQVSRPLVTIWNGEETRNTAEPGDWIVTNLTPTGKVLRDSTGSHNRYVIRASDFDKYYERAIGECEFGPMFKSRGFVEALLLPGGFDIIAPWGERQVGKSGYLIRKDAEIYCNELSAFAQTYVVEP